MLALQPIAGCAARGERERAVFRTASAAPHARALRPRRLRLVAASGVPRPRAAAATVPADVLKSYQRLQNGSDVRGVALPGVAGQDVTLSPERCAPPQHPRAVAEKGN